MIKLFIGGKGSGKTKALIELVNNAANTTSGSVVCIEKGDKLKLDITYKARLIDSDFYAISNAEALYGFISGILASNNDITDIFVDGALKICDVAGLCAILPKLEEVAKNVNLVMTASIPVEECPEAIKKYA
jgi:phage terminase large subunit-like protein